MTYMHRGGLGFRVQNRRRSVGSPCWRSIPFDTSGQNVCATSLSRAPLSHSTRGPAWGWGFDVSGSEVRSNEMYSLGGQCSLTDRSHVHCLMHSGLPQAEDSYQGRTTSKVSSLEIQRSLKRPRKGLELTSACVICGWPKSCPAILMEAMCEAVNHRAIMAYMGQLWMGATIATASLQAGTLHFFF